MNRAGFGVPALAGCAPSAGRDRLKPGLRTSSWVGATPFLAPIGTMNHEGKTSNIEHRTSNSEDPLGVKPFGVRGSRFKVRSSRFMKSPHPLASVNRNHEPRRVWSTGFTRLLPFSRRRPAKAGTPNKFMGRADAISGAHWDHEPKWRSRSAVLKAGPAAACPHAAAPSLRAALQPRRSKARLN